MDLTINDLPTEMLSKILNLSLKDEKDVLNKVHAFRNIVFVSKEFQDISITLVIPKIFQFFSGSIPGLRYTKFSEYYQKYCSLVTAYNSSIKNILDFSKLKYLSLVGSSDISDDSLKHLKGLEFLSLILTRSSPGLSIDDSLLNLKSLRFNRSTVKSLKSKSIKSLSLTNVTHLATDDLLSNLPNLKNLELNSKTYIEPCKLTNLEMLGVVANDCDIGSLCNLKSLKNLNITKRKAINENLSNLNNLKRLMLDYHSNITAEGVNLCKNLTSLVCLDTDGHWFDDSKLINKDLKIRRIPVKDRRRL